MNRADQPPDPAAASPVDDSAPGLPPALPISFDPSVSAPADGVIVAPWAAANVIAFTAAEGRNVIVLRADGTIEIDPAATPSEAARLFIAALQPQLRALYAGDRRALDDLKLQVFNLEAEARRWRERCAAHEAHYSRLESAAADVKGRLEQFLIVLQHGRPQGTQERA